jgi:glycosyltransferase involved in cell wall biosynthesis
MSGRPAVEVAPVDTTGDASPAAGKSRQAGLRICMLAETFHPVVGGCESQARLLAEQLAARGHSVLVVTRRTDRGLPRLASLGPVRVLRVGPQGPGGFKRWPMLVPAWSALFRRRRDFDVVLILGMRALGMLAAPVHRWGVGCVLKAESNGEMSGAYFGPRLEALRLNLSSFPVHMMLRARNIGLMKADAFVAISSSITAELVTAGVPPARIAHIPNAVDTEVFRPPTSEERAALRARLGFGPGDRVVTFTGRLVRYKGLPLLLEVWERLAADDPTGRLVLVGGGGHDMHNCEDELRSFVRDRRLEGRVSFTGDIDHVHEYLRASDCFVFPSLNEAFGISLIEALACGLPVVASATGGIPDIVEDGVNGILVPVGDGAALGRALRSLLADPEQAARLGAAGRRTVRERYSVEAVVTAYEDLLRRCAGS